MVASMVRYTSGYLCVPPDAAICTGQSAHAVNQDKNGTAYTVTRCTECIGTEISASDRANTMRLPLADPTSVRRFHPAPVTWFLAGQGWWGSAPARPHRAAVDLASDVGRNLRGRFARSSKDDSSMAHTDETAVFADEQWLVDHDLIEGRRKHGTH